jgi:hypothetical protein
MGRYISASELPTISVSSWKYSIPESLASRSVLWHVAFVLVLVFVL